MIQCARLAFGFVGVYDQDEAERIVEKDITPTAEVIPAGASRTEAVKARLRGNIAPAPVDLDTGEISEEAGAPPIEGHAEFLAGLGAGSEQ